MCHTHKPAHLHVWLHQTLVRGGSLVQATNFSFLVTTQTHQPKLANTVRAQNQSFSGLLGWGHGGVFKSCILAVWKTPTCPSFEASQELCARSQHGDYQNSYGHFGVSPTPVCCRLSTEQDFLLWFKRHSPEHKVQYFTKSTAVIRTTWSSAFHILKYRQENAWLLSFVHISSSADKFLTELQNPKWTIFPKQLPLQ